MTPKPYFITLIRPVGSNCWTTQRLAPTKEAAERQAQEERNAKIVFKDGSVHLQSTAIVCVMLPNEPDTTQQHYEPELHGFGIVKAGIP